MDAEEEERTVAVKLYLKGEKRTNICKDLNRLKGWLSKWVNRYKTGKEEWYKLRHFSDILKEGQHCGWEIEQCMIMTNDTADIAINKPIV